MAEVASAFVTLLPSARGFGTATERQISPELDRSGGSLGKRFGTAFKVGAAAAIGGVFAAAKLGKEVLSEASDLAEASNVVGLTFRKNADDMEKFFDSAASSIGMSESAAKQSAANVGGLLNNMGFTRKESSKLSKDLLKLGADMGSAFNADPAEAIAAIGSGLRGEAEPLRRFNVMLDKTATKNKAVEMGLAASAEEVDKNAEAQAALALLMEQTADVQGDFANTSDSYANVQRRVSAQIDDLQAKLGEKLLPVAEKVFGFIGDKAIPWVEDLFESFKTGNGPMSGFTDVLKDVWPAVKSVATWIGEELVPALAKLAGDILDGAKKGFDNLKQAIENNRPFIDTLIDGIGAVATVVVEDVLPAIGKFFKIYLPALGKAIGVAIGIIKNLSIAWLEMVGFATRAFAGLLDAAFFTFDKILAGVEKAFFWNPVVSNAAAAARNAIGNMRDDVIPKLDSIGDAADRVADALRGIPSEKQIRISVSMSQADKVALQLERFGGFRASGGAVTGGTSYIVGEEGPELFTPNTSGRIVPNHKLDPSIGSGGGGNRRMQLVVGDRVFDAYVREVADGSVAGAQTFAGTRTRAGMRD